MQAEAAGGPQIGAGLLPGWHAALPHQPQVPGALLHDPQKALASGGPSLSWFLPRVMAEQHIHLAHRRPGFIGIICTDLSLPDAIAFAAQRTRQARRSCLAFLANCLCTRRQAPHYWVLKLQLSLTAEFTNQTICAVSSRFAWKAHDMCPHLLARCARRRLGRPQRWSSTGAPQPWPPCPTWTATWCAPARARQPLRSRTGWLWTGPCRHASTALPAAG